MSLSFLAMVPSQKLCQFRGDILRQRCIDLSIEKNTNDQALDGEAEEQMIPAQAKNPPRIFRNLDSLVCDRISSLNNSGRYHVSFDPNQWLYTHDCCSTKTESETQYTWLMVSNLYRSRHCASLLQDSNFLWDCKIDRCEMARQWCWW